MRKPTMKFLFALTIIGGLSGATATHAAAGPADTYREAMKPFLPVIEAWADDVDGLAHAAVAKPELACSAEMADLAARGGYMSGDLAGTDAPDALAAAHATLTAAVADLGAVAASACADPAATGAEVEAQVEILRDALNKIRTFTDSTLRLRGPEPVVPVRPGTDI